MRDLIQDKLTSGVNIKTVNGASIMGAGDIFIGGGGLDSGDIVFVSSLTDLPTASGGGTYNSGVQYTDNKALFVNCKGINNSDSIANYYMSDNATVTNVITVATPLKIAGTTTANSINQKFTHTSNRETYTGAINRNFKVTATVSVTSASANDQIGFYVAKNGTVLTESEMYVTTNASARAESVTIQTLVSLVTNDYIEIWVENDTDASDVTVTFLNVVIEPLN